MSSLQMPNSQFLETLKHKNQPLRMEYLSSGQYLSHLPMSAVPEFALVGRSNVGKSSLLNFMAGQKNLARVSHTPGRTQLINLFKVEKGEFLIADLPGYGYAESPQESRAHWQQSLEEYFEKRNGLICILFLVDMRRDVLAEDENLSRWLQSLNLNIVGVQTKCDKIHKSKWQEIKQQQAKALALSPEQMVITSSSQKLGLQNLFLMMAGQLESYE